MIKNKTGKTKLIILAVLVLILLVTGWFASRYFIKPNNYRTARLTDFKGEVVVIKYNAQSGAKSVMTAFQGMSLTPGDQLITGADSWVILDIGAAEKEIKIFAESQVNVSDLERENQSQGSKTILEMLTGKLVANLKKKLEPNQKFEIRTPTTVAGARGTFFYVEYQKGKTKVAVLEGQVGVSLRIRKGSGPQPAEVTLKKSQQTVIEKSMTPAMEIPVEEIQPESLDRDFIGYIQENPGRVETKVLEEIKSLMDRENQLENQPETKPTEVQEPVSPVIKPTSRQGSTITATPISKTSLLKPTEKLKPTVAPEPTSEISRRIDGHLEVPEGTVIPAEGVEITLTATRIKKFQGKTVSYQIKVRLEPNQRIVNFNIPVSPNNPQGDGYIVSYSFDPAKLPEIPPKGYYSRQNGELKIVTQAKDATVFDVSLENQGGADLILPSDF